MRFRAACIGVILGISAALASAQRSVATERGLGPLADHHQHLFSAELAAVMSSSQPVANAKLRTAADLVAQLDAAGIRRAVVLSTAYIFEQPSRHVTDAEAKLRADNDWTSRQVAQFPDRLIGFCGINPVKAYALAELARCGRDPNLRHGLKLHFGNSVVDLHNPQHVEQLQRVFRAANQQRMAIVVHLHASVTEKLPYGREEGLIFLNQILPSAPDVVVQVAHMAGSGAPNDEGAYQVLDVLADAITAHDRRANNLYFDITAIPDRVSPEDARRWTAAIRRVGIERVLFGSDAAGSFTPAAAWTTLRGSLQLNGAEFDALARNVPPYLR